MADGLSNIVLGTCNGRVHRQTTRHECCNSGRESAAGSMGMACRDTRRAQFSKAFPIEVHVYRISSTMASLHHDMAGGPPKKTLGGRPHILPGVQTPAPPHLGPEEGGGDQLPPRQH